MSRSFSTSSVPGISSRSRIAGDVVDELGSALGGEVADDPLARTDPVAP